MKWILHCLTGVKISTKVTGVCFFMFTLYILLMTKQITGGEKATKTLVKSFPTTAC